MFRSYAMQCTGYGTRRRLDPAYLGAHHIAQAQRAQPRLEVVLLAAEFQQVVVHHPIGNLLEELERLLVLLVGGGERRNLNFRLVD